MRPSQAIAALLLLSGCAAPASDPSDEAPIVPLPRTHALLGVLEPADLTEPAFAVLPPLATIRGGEPSVWAHTNGSLFVTFPGCENGNTCVNGPLYRSDDGGTNWTRLNQASSGSLDPRGKPPANGDADVAVDSSGNVFVTHLAQDGVHFFRSLDQGVNWRHMGNIGGSADRQWMTAMGPGHVIVAWMDTGSSSGRQVAVRTTTDAGDTWTNAAKFGTNIGWLGTVQSSPDGARAYIPFTDNDGPVPGAPGLFTNTQISLKVLVSSDAGASWKVVDTKARVPRVHMGLHWSGVLMAPALDVTADGSVVYAWSQDATENGATSVGSRLRYVASRDGGETWSPPRTIPTRANAVLPWVVGGGGDRFAVTYYASDARTTPDEASEAVWDTMIGVIDGAGADPPTLVTSTIEKRVHVGKLCVRGGTCGSTQSDRSMLDFFENDVLPDGRIVVTYIRNEGDATRLQVKVALQTGGSRLFTAPTSN